MALAPGVRLGPYEIAAQISVAGRARQRSQNEPSVDQEAVNIAYRPR